jgi:hypothetical protein
LEIGFAWKADVEADGDKLWNQQHEKLVEFERKHGAPCCFEVWHGEERDHCSKGGQKRKDVNVMSCATQVQARQTFWAVGSAGSGPFMSMTNFDLIEKNFWTHLTLSLQSALLQAPLT